MNTREALFTASALIPGGTAALLAGYALLDRVDDGAGSDDGASLLEWVLILAAITAIAGVVFGVVKNMFEKQGNAISDVNIEAPEINNPGGGN